jgi:hypothetical protein
MANFKRRRSKNQRAGCLLCKPHKQCGAKHELRHTDKKKSQMSENPKDHLGRILRPED